MDFPQFYDVHHLIPQVLELQPKHAVERYYDRLEDANSWETYLKYRQIAFDFLTHRARSGHLFVGQDRYIRLAKYLFNYSPIGHRVSVVALVPWFIVSNLRISSPGK